MAKIGANAGTVRERVLLSRAGSIPKFFGSGSVFQATFGSGSDQFYCKYEFRYTGSRGFGFSVLTVLIYCLKSTKMFTKFEVL